MLLTDLETAEITLEDYEECAMNWLTATRKRVEPKTTNRRLTSLRRFSVWAGWDASFQDYNAPTALAAKPHPLPEGIAGVKRMIFFAESPDQEALVALCGLMGLRISEALSVRASDFNVHNRTLIVRGKGDKQRTVPISDAAFAALNYCVVESFAHGNMPLCNFKDRSARALITRLGKKASICRRVASHDLRATFATEVYRKTRDIRLVQLLLGHSSVKQTEVYIGIAEEALKAGVEL